MQNRLDRNFPERIKSLSLAPGARLIVMSDMHRGDGTGSDDFAHNSLIFKCALDYYLDNGFTYIELGDGEELWENKGFDQIYITHTSVYDRLAKFHDRDPEKTRYIKVWGNHDIRWKDNKSPLDRLFLGIKVYEGIIIDSSILLVHGHQADPKCYGKGATISRYFVHNFWTTLQRLGLRDPTRAAENPGLCNRIDDELYKWAKNNNRGIDIVIAGHTHRPVYENLSLTERRCLESNIRTNDIRKKPGPDPVYYNTGSCVHPRCITGLEITMPDCPYINRDTGRDDKPCFRLVKWGYFAEVAKEDGGGYRLNIKRTILEE